MDSRLRDSVLGEYSADLAHFLKKLRFACFETTADHKSSSVLKCAKNSKSPTAMPRILEEEIESKWKIKLKS